MSNNNKTQILNLKEAIKNGKQSQGLIYIMSEPQLRPGRRDYILGDLMFKGYTAQFRSWETDVIAIIRDNGQGIYKAETLGQEYKGNHYINIRSIDLYVDEDVTIEDFQDRVPTKLLEANWAEVMDKLEKRGLSNKTKDLIDEIINDPALEGKFFTEGAAIKHHDNQIGGLWHHTTKMLRIFIALLDNNKELLEHIDLLSFAIVVHDIGKVFEYDNIATSEFWYANHRVRGIEFLVSYRDKIIEQYNEEFYHQVQAVISGHHGEYGDRPTTVAAVIVHYIDSIESQVSEIVRDQGQAEQNKFYTAAFGFLQGLPEK